MSAGPVEPPRPETETVEPDRPGVPVPGRRDWLPLACLVVLLLALVAWMMGPLWPNATTAIAGDPDTDAVRGMWGFDHVRRSLVPPNTPLWTGEVNFPNGAMALVLPSVSFVLLAPLGELAGPIAGWNFAVAAMLVATGLASGWLAKVATGSWIPGVVVGAGMATQPMLLFSISDGTPEHLAFWTVPITIGCAVQTARVLAPGWGLATALALVLTALDSPYHAIYAVICIAFVAPLGILQGRRLSGWRTQLAWTSGAFFVPVALGAFALALMYQRFDITPASGRELASLLQMNATDLHTWWQFDWGPSDRREMSLAPTLVPAAVLVPSLILGLLGLPRSGPWLLGFLFTLVLSFGLNSNITPQLQYWFGEPGLALAKGLVGLNSYLLALPGLRSIRFPRRWLAPATLCLLVAAGWGLRRVLERLPGSLRLPTALVLAIGVGWAGVHGARFDVDFPQQDVPEVSFAEWIERHPTHGAVAMVPRTRPAPATGQRSDLPVFADITQSLSSSDQLYLQVRMGRPIVGAPSLKTLHAPPLSQAHERVLHSWDDMAHPILTGNEIPRSAYDSGDERWRKQAIAEFHDEGLRFVVLDAALFTDEALAHVRSQLAPFLEEEQEFADGTGVRVLVLTD